LLNFGHTFGHALEAATDFTALLHGEAVLLGMRTAAWLSKELGHLTEEAWTDIESTLGRIPIKGAVDTNADRILRNFKHDKKGENRVILLRTIGDAFVTKVSEKDIRRAIEHLLLLA